MRTTRFTRHGAAAAAAAGSAALLLAACGGGSDGAGPDEEIELRLAWWGEAERAAATQEAIDAFTAEHPNISVVPESGDFEPYFDKLATQTAAGDAPDVFALGGAYPLEYGANGALLDLGSLPDDLDMSAFDEAETTNATVDGTVYGAPTGGNAIALIANTALFDEAGIEVPQDTADMTWDEFADLATDLSRELPEDTYGFEMRVNDILGVYAGQRDGGIYTWEGTLGVDAATLTEFWEMERGLITSGAQPDAETTVEFEAQSPELTLMGTGRAAMTFGYSNLLGTYEEASGDDLVLLTVPGESEFTKPGTTVLPSQFWAIGARTEHPEAAAMLVDWLVNSPEAASSILADRGLSFNDDVVAAIEQDLSESDQEVAAFQSTVEAEPAPPQPEGGSILNDTTTRLNQDVMFERATPEDAAQAFVDELSAALE
ncbi:extracellular solute-binding protein [Myceligenerans cantabricum]